MTSKQYEKLIEKYEEDIQSLEEQINYYRFVIHYKDITIDNLKDKIRKETKPCRQWIF